MAETVCDPATSSGPTIFRGILNSKGQVTSRRVLDDFCTVCGKPATGMHYRSLSCNGCRSFFRRTIAYDKSYNCKGMGYDERACFQRHRCKRCRMALCRAAGMDPEAVHVDDAGALAVADFEDQWEEAPLVPYPPNRIECKLEKMMQSLLLVEDAHHKLRISTYSPRLLPGITIDDFASGPSKLGMHFGAMHAQPYDPISIRLIPEEVYIKQRIIIDFSKFDYSTRKLWMFQDVVFAIEFIKALPIFHLLDDCSQRVLLASAITCSNFTSAFYSYCQHSDRTCFPDGSIMTWSKEIQEQSPDSTRFHTELIGAIRDAQLDTREYTLLKMIIVCNPMLDGLCPYDVTLLQHEKERYTKTLLSYVLARRGVREGPAIFTQILSIAEVVMRLTRWQKSQHILILAMGLHKYHCPFAESIFHSQ